MSIQIASRVFASLKEVEQLLIHAATMYDINGYAEDFESQEITDPEYDELYRYVKTNLPQSQAFIGTSPSLAKTKGSTVKHTPPMTSIEKSDGTDDEKKAIYNKWLSDCAQRLSVRVEDLQIAQSYKRDGVALRINYVKGKLVSAGLRPRDGINGSDVTRHMKYIKGVPASLPLPLTLSLNGEIECWNADFVAVNASQDLAGEDAYKNPRNYTAGCMGRDDPEENKNSRLRIAYYSITGFEDWEQYYKTEVDRAKWANSVDGLNLVDEEGKGYFVQVRLHEFKHLSMMEEYAKKLPYYTDGIILKINDIAQQLELGHVGDDSVNPPRGSLAWKFAEETAEAIVSRIEWNASRTGRIVPKAIFDIPFILADTENQRATCNNYGWMKERGLGPGAKVRCKKGGKIIPNIMEVITPVTDLDAPTNCPTCATPLILSTSSGGNQDLVCDNLDCGAKHVKGWIFFVTNMGGKGLGASAMEKILQTGKVKTIPDLYELSADDLVEAGFSERQATLALATIYGITAVKDNDVLQKSIDKARTSVQEVEGWKFFKALGIAGAGESAGKALISHYKDFDKIRAATAEELKLIAGIGETTAAAIAEYFEKNKVSVDRLLKRVQLLLPKSGKLTGTNFVLTGAFAKGKAFWQAKIEEQGGNVQSSVGKTTNYLVQELGKSDGSPSEKENKATKLGVPIISVADLEKLL